MVDTILLPVCDINLDRERLAAEGGFSLMVYFPEFVPETSRIEAAWEALSCLSLPGGIVITGMGSADAERFDRKKPPAFSRLGDVRRNGFRAIAYEKAE